MTPTPPPPGARASKPVLGSGTNEMKTVAEDARPNPLLSTPSLPAPHRAVEPWTPPREKGQPSNVQCDGPQEVGGECFTPYCFQMGTRHDWRGPPAPLRNGIPTSTAIFVGCPWEALPNRCEVLWPSRASIKSGLAWARAVRLEGLLEEQRHAVVGLQSRPIGMTQVLALPSALHAHSAE